MAIDHAWDGPATGYEALYERGLAMRSTLGTSIALSGET
jgi:hypothetical protein